MSRPRKSPVARPSSAQHWLRWLTHVAFVLAIAVIIARFTTPDVLRDPWGPTPDPNPIAAGPGATTGLVFDLLAMLPAVLIWIRAALDRDYFLRYRHSYPILFALAVLMLLSSLWASDRFLALVTAMHFFSASCLLWAMSQLVRTAVRFRIVAAVSFGLLLVMVTQSVMYRFVEVPANISYWNEKKVEILKARNWTPDSFEAKQFEHRLTSGEPLGFFNSANSVAAVAVLLFFTCVGIGVQKIREGEQYQWLTLSVIAGAALIWILIDARSKTSAATPFIGAFALIFFFMFRRRIIQHHRSAFFLSLAGSFVMLLAVAGHGLYHHGLFPGHFSNSLDFRWKYWVASIGIVKTHPLVGVGWGNFGLSYLAHRLPEAAEEIKDPHNFLVRFLTELGLIGLLISIAWLIRVAWEITKPAAETESAGVEIEPTIRAIVIAVVMGMLLHILANVDFSLSVVDTITLLLKPLLFTLTLLLGSLAGSMRSPQKWTLDNRSIPFIFYFLVTGLGLFLLHNLIDFSWFEPGALTCFMALIGSALGCSHVTGFIAARRWQSIASASVVMLVWFAIALGLVLPVMLAEDAAHAGDIAIQTAPADRSEEALAHYRNAAEEFATAASWVPYNSDYVFRQAQATLTTGDYTGAERLLSRVQTMNPLQIDARLLDANLRLTSSDASKKIVVADFERAIRLNPNDVSIHLQYAHALEHFSETERAAEQYQLALAANAALPIGEPKRLSEQQVNQIRNAMQGHR